MSSIGIRLQEVKARLASACIAAGRGVDSVTLLAVSKTQGPDAVREAAAAGQRAFGENYVQEALDKMAALRDLPLQWHLIGPLQSNKTRVVAEAFDWVHSVDRLKIAQRLADQRPAHLPPLQLCLQVNEQPGFDLEYDQESLFLRSDHANFAQRGVPVAFFFTGLHMDYHQPSDTPDQIHDAKLLRVARYVHGIALQLAMQDGRPGIDPKLWQAFRERDRRGSAPEQPAAPLLPADK